MDSGPDWRRRKESSHGLIGPRLSSIGLAPEIGISPTWRRRKESSHGLIGPRLSSVGLAPEIGISPTWRRRKDSLSAHSTMPTVLFIILISLRPL